MTDSNLRVAWLITQMFKEGDATHEAEDNGITARGGEQASCCRGDGVPPGTTRPQKEFKLSSSFLPPLPFSVYEFNGNLGPSKNLLAPKERVRV